MLTENRLYAMTDGQKGGPIIDFEFGIRNSEFGVWGLGLVSWNFEYLANTDHITSESIEFFNLCHSSSMTFSNLRQGITRLHFINF